MVEFVKRQLNPTHCKQYRFLPAKVKENKFCVTKELYKQSDWDVTISITGLQEPKSYPKSIACTVLIVTMCCFPNCWRNMLTH